MNGRTKKWAGIGLALASSITLSACTEGYGYSGVSVGYGSPGYYGYDDYAYGSTGYYGWYNDYYYPGNGYWIYDRQGQRHRWNDDQRRYWEGRRQAWRGNRGNDRGADNGRPRDHSGQVRPPVNGVETPRAAIREPRTERPARSWNGRGDANRGRQPQATSPQSGEGNGRRGIFDRRSRDR